MFKNLLVSFILILVTFFSSCGDDSNESNYKKKISVLKSNNFIGSKISCSFILDSDSYYPMESQSTWMIIPVSVRLFSSSGISFDQTFSIDFNNFAEMNGMTFSLTENLKVTFNFNSDQRSGYEYSNPVHSGWIRILRNKTDFITIESTETSASFGVEITSPVWGDFSADEQVYDFTDGIDISAQLEVVR